MQVLAGNRAPRAKRPIDAENWVEYPRRLRIFHAAMRPGATITYDVLTRCAAADYKHPLNRVAKRRTAFTHPDGFVQAAGITMAESSGSLTSSLTVEPQGFSKLLHALGLFLIRRRILLSGILFCLLIAKDLAYGFKPHDLFNASDPWGIAGGVLVCLGLALRSWAAGVLRKDQELTTTGPYRLIRNPLYAGSFLMMFGFCALLGDPKSIWLILGPVLLVYFVKVRQEEQLLARLFPAEWSKYASRTPRFIPFVYSGNLSADWRVSQWMRSREYQALCATLFGLIAIQLWHALG